MNKSKKDLIKISLLFASVIAVFYLGIYTMAYSHELINQNIFRAYGINSTIALYYPAHLVNDSWIIPDAPKYALSATSPNVIQFTSLANKNPVAFEIMVGQLKQNESLATQARQIDDNALLLAVGYVIFFIIIAWKDDIKNRWIK